MRFKIISKLMGEYLLIFKSESSYMSEPNIICSVTETPPDNLIVKKESNVHYYGFDYLRAIFCLGIVLWHSGALTSVADPTLEYALSYYYGCLGVPVFFQLSNFLYSNKAIDNKKPLIPLLKRVIRLLEIYLIWLILNWALCISNPDFSSNFVSTKAFLYFIIGNNTHLYYLFILILLTIISQFVLFFFRFQGKYAKIIQYAVLGILFVISLIIMVIGSYLADLMDFSVGYANPLNFLPYVFSAIFIVLILKKADDPTKKKAMLLIIILLAVLSIIFALIEKNALETNMIVYQNLPYKTVVYYTYARISLVLLSSLIIILAFYIKSKPPKFITIISDCSLGVYVIQIIVLDVINNWLYQFGKIVLDPFLIGFITFGVCVLLTYIFKYYSKNIL